MARKTANNTAAPLNADFSDLADVGVRQGEAYLEAQSALLQRMQETNATWVKRLQTESALASELATRLTAARSIPDATSAWQAWTSQHMALLTEDAKRAATDAQEFIRTGTRAFTGSWSPGNSSGGLAQGTS